MLLDVRIKEEDKKLILVTKYDDNGLLKLNYEDRKDNPTGRTKNGGFRRITSIDTYKFYELLRAGDRDAVEYHVGYDDATIRPALRRLLARFPEWRASEARI